MPEPASTIPAPLAIVVSRYNRPITDRLLAGAIDAYAQAGGTRGELAVIDAPGAFELVHLSHVAASTGEYRGVLALGCIIRGQTRHDRYISRAVAEGLVRVSLMASLPVCFGVLTVETPEQALARAGGAKGDKGAESMTALLQAIASGDAVRRAVESGSPCRVVTPSVSRPDKSGVAP